VEIVALTLFADRFLLAGQGRALDLASGREVTIRLRTFPDRSALQAWLQQCAALMALDRAPLEPLVDFGLAGRDQHFEAVGCRPRRSAHRSPPGGAGCRGRHPTVAIRGASARATEQMIQRLGEVLDTGISGRPRTLQVCLPNGVERVRALDVIARESRLRGYVPVNAGLYARGRPLVAAPAALREELRSILHGRHAVVLHDGSLEDREWAAALFMSVGLDSDRPHVLLVVRDETMTYTDQPLTVVRTSRLHAREQQADYGPPAATAAPSGPCRTGPPGAIVAWEGAKSDLDLARPRAKIACALETAARGRHASAVRLLRDTLGMLTRRRDLPGAGESALALGRILLTRGQVAAAAAAFEQSRVLFDQAGLTARSTAAALFVGLAWTDAGRWLEAEAATRAALIACATTRDEESARFGGLVLSRCLFWQGRYAEALQALPPDEAATTARANRVSEAVLASAQAAGPLRHPRVDDSVVRGCLAARIAIGAGNLQAAGSAAACARERATLAGRPEEIALACTALAAVYAALGDASTIRALVEEGLQASRAAHAPLRALRLRTVLAEGLLRAGKGCEARVLVARLARLDLDSLPAVVRTPVERVVRWQSGAPHRSPAGGAPPGAAAIDRAARDLSEADAAAARLEVVDTLVEILGLCQSIEDEEQVVRRVVGILRARVRAVAMACFGLSEERVHVVAEEGRAPIPGEVAQRAADVGLAIVPGATISGLEAATPVRCGGRIIGVLACRWAADVQPDWPVAGALLAAAAAAIAPCLRCVLDRRAAPALSHDPAPDEIVGVSHALKGLREEIERAARAPFNVVIEGESGSGKELVARAIHRLGPRRHHRLCAINCAALTDDLLEAELFGHARGAFTGAVAERKGLFEEAHGGTLVLDEVGELTPRAQAKLLRAIQEGEVRRLGENFARSVDARIVAASNRALRPAVEAGVFRRDLLYRLEVIRIVVPALRERVDDIPLLAVHFWRQATARLGSRATLAPGTLAALARYDWPGNVRELQNVMAALAVAAGRRGSVGPERLPSAIAGQAASVRGASLDEARRLFETRFVRAALARAGGQRARAAKELGLTRQGLTKLLARLGIEPDGRSLTAARQEVAAGAGGPGAGCSLDPA
jgi:DNA-binding NtrC family response regulator/tetratricopeptide (TPR) repeat protein